MTRRVVTVNGKPFVMIEQRELRRLERLAVKANAAADRGANALPALSLADARGNRPAVAFARASIARSIVQEWKAAGLSQQQLARRAGVRQETISRIESGKHSPTVRTVEKIDRVLQAALRKGRRPNNARKRPAAAKRR